MADKNFTMKQKTSGGYDTLYPQTIDEQVKLSASISSLFGGTDVNDALAVLGQYNRYCWKRTTVGANNWTYVYSTNRNQYPDDGIFGGYKYLFLNKPLENCIDTTKIATGSYVGTGVAGSSNQNSLTFNFIPKMLIICKEVPHGAVGQAPYIRGLVPYNYTSNQMLPWYLSGIWFEGQNRFQVLDFTLGENMVNVSYNTISWYTTNAGESYAAPQLNAQGYTYHYIAIG